MRTAATKRNAPGQGGVFGRVNSKCIRANYPTTCSPVQFYELLKSEFVASRPEVLHDEYEAACQRFARRAGL